MKTVEKLLFELRKLEVSLWIEGDRLRYRAPEGTMNPTLLDQIRSRKEEILTFLRSANTATKNQRPPLLPFSRKENLQPSFSQHRLWLLQQFEPDTPANNMPVVVRFTGKLDISVLEKSLSEIVRRHEILRTTFPSVNGLPVPTIAEAMPISVPVLDMQNIPIEQRDEETHRLASEKAKLPFDLLNGPIVWFKLFRLAEQEHLLLWNMHAIVCDGTSADLFYQELTALYTAFSTGQSANLPELPIQYADFAQWQRQWLQGEVLESYLKFWKQKLGKPLPPALQLPTDYPRPLGTPTYLGARYARMLPKQLHRDLMRVSQQLGTTLFVTLLATFNILLYRYSQQTELLTSFVSSGRSQVETEALMGFFSNTLVLRSRFEKDSTFRTFASQIHQSVLEIYNYQDLPFEKLVEELEPAQNQSRSPLFQVKFTLNPPWTNGNGMASVALPDLNIEALFGYIYNGKTKFDLTLVTREQEEGLGAVFDFNADLFDTATIERMMGHFQTLLNNIVLNPDRPISSLPLLTDIEQQQFLVWNQAYPDEHELSCIHRLFEEQVKLNPDTVALIHKDEQLTYRQLNNRANQLARHLQKLDIRPKTPIGVLLERSPEAVIATLAILKAGGVYIPLSPGNSEDRLNLILQESQISIVLTKELISKTLHNDLVKFICLDFKWETIQQQPTENLQINIGNDGLAAVLYSVDQTKPTQGIGFSHKNIVNLISNTDYKLDTTDVSLQITPCSSASTFVEIWGCLLKGAKLIVPSENSLSPGNLGHTIQQHQVTALFLPTRLFHRMVDEQPKALKSVRKLFTGGDWLSPDHVQRFHRLLSNCILFNVYSVAKNTGLTCCYAVKDPLPTHTTIPIGKAIANTQAYVLDRHLQPVPMGIAGELYIGGDCLAQSHNNNPKVTDTTFIFNPFAQEPDARLCKTGDLVRYLPDGNLELISRIDELETIQDLRTENGRIETALCQHSAIREAYVLSKPEAPNAEELIAYIVLHSNQTIAIAELRQFLKRKLSAHMVPTLYVVLDILPLDQNGEINRHALLRENTSTNLSEESVNPRDEVEQQLSNIWENLLGCQSITIYDNFFELGGNSLLSVRLVNEIEKVFDYNFALSSFFQLSTIAEIAQRIREKPFENSALEGIPSNLCLEDYRALISHNAGRGGKHLGKRGLIVEISPEDMKSSQPFVWIGDLEFSKRLKLKQPIYSMPATSWTPLHSPENHVSAIATLLVNELLSVQASGPFVIGAYCYEGLVAMEMAQQLQMQGQEVQLLAIIDRPGPSRFHRLYLKLDEFLSIPRFHSMKLSQLSLADKWSYISKRLQFWAEDNDLNESESQGGYNPITPETNARHLEAIRSYLPRKYTGRVALFKSTKLSLTGTTKDLLRTDVKKLFPYDGWEGILTGNVSIYEMSCRHLEIPLNPYASEVGYILNQYLPEIN